MSGSMAHLHPTHWRSACHLSCFTPTWWSLWMPLSVLSLAHAGSHVGDTTGCLPGIHSHFPLPEALMACAAAESTSPDGLLLLHVPTD